GDLSPHDPELFRRNAARNDRRAARRSPCRTLRLDRRHRSFHDAVHPELQSDQAPRIDLPARGDGDPAQRDRAARREPLQPLANRGTLMAKLRLTVACGDYDIIRPLKDGIVEAAGLELIFLTDMGPSERHWRLARKTEFDVCEENVGAYFIARDQGHPITAIPVFLHRRFRHGFGFINTAAGIKSPKDRIGK